MPGVRDALGASLGAGRKPPVGVKVRGGPWQSARRSLHFPHLLSNLSPTSGRMTPVSFDNGFRRYTLRWWLVLVIAQTASMITVCLLLIGSYAGASFCWRRRPLRCGTIMPAR